MECSKIQYKDRKAAEKQAKQYNKKESGKLNITVYKCAICGTWHLGGNLGAKRKKSWKYSRRG